MLDLFSGCGGFSEGFECQGDFRLIAAVEWAKSPRNTLARRLKDRWGIEDAEDRVLHFDMQDTERLFKGWANDANYGNGKGIDSLVGHTSIDVVIGGPPCQAYSIAGRIRDEFGMKNDYRNFLFESYLTVINRYKPKAFLFENVPGLLSAKPDGTPIVDRIQKEFDRAGWVIPKNIKATLVDFSEFGLPQKRKRIILLGLSKYHFGSCADRLISKFYNELLPQYRKPAMTVGETILDLPKIFPIETKDHQKISHKKICSNNYPSDHMPRYHNARDISIFNMLAEDIRSGHNRYTSTSSLKKLYTKLTGKQSNVHKYHVLRSDQPSNLIPAHLHKDGLRHIHPDPIQSRSLTVREAARLQGFPDDFEFFGSNGDKYKMIGNAVPPTISFVLADALKRLLTEGRV